MKEGVPAGSEEMVDGVPTGKKIAASVLDAPRTAASEAGEHYAGDDTDDAGDDPPRHVRSGPRENAAAPDDATDSRSIHVALRFQPKPRQRNRFPACAELRGKSR